MGEQSRTCLIFVFAMAAAGCGSDGPVDLGHSVVGENLVDYAGSWEGHTEAFKWDAHSDAIRLRLDESGKGVFEVGDVTAPPPTTTTEFGLPINPARSQLMPGFDYSVADAVVSSKRVRLSVSSQEVFSRWCSGFEPVADANNAGQFGCLPNFGWTFSEAEGCRFADEKRTPFDCNKSNCLMLCACDADSCDAMISPGDVEIDAALSSGNEELAGTLLVGSSRLNIRMQRTP